MIEVYLTFYPPSGSEVTERLCMPGVPVVGQTVHWSLDGTEGGSRAWTVRHSSWVCDDQNRSVWHVEVGLW